MPTRTVLSTSVVNADHPKGLKVVEIFRAKYNKAGLGEDAAQYLNENAAFAAYLEEGIRRFSIKMPNCDTARMIMGTNFFGIEEAVKHFGVNPTQQQLDALAVVPFTEEVLQFSRDTHILVAVFPLSILDIRGQVERKLFYSHEDAWYNQQASAKDKGKVSWQLVRKVPVADSANKTWSQQQMLLSSDEETPMAQLLVYTIIGHFLVTGKRLFERIYVRCADTDSVGDRVRVVGFDADGLYIGRDWDGARVSNLGLASARKV